jgi:hypothetical protein
MKTLTRSAKKPQRSLVPITAFEFESFGVRVRRVARHRPVPTGVFACQNSPASQDNAVEVFLAVALAPGLGAMCLRSEARPPLIRSRFLPAIRAAAANAVVEEPSKQKAILGQAHN